MAFMHEHMNAYSWYKNKKIKIKNPNLNMRNAKK